jgi:hypothetical protein
MLRFEHPKNVCMTYFKHMKLSLYLSYLLAKASTKAMVHAFLPDTFITSTSDLTAKIQDILKKSGCRENDKSM